MSTPRRDPWAFMPPPVPGTGPSVGIRPANEIGGADTIIKETKQEIMEIDAAERRGSVIPVDMVKNLHRTIAGEHTQRGQSFSMRLTPEICKAMGIKSEAKRMQLKKMLDDEMKSYVKSWQEIDEDALAEEAAKETRQQKARRIGTAR